MSSVMPKLFWKIDLGKPTCWETMEVQLKYAFTAISRERGIILNQTDKLRQGKLSIEEFNRNVELRRNYRISFERDRRGPRERPKKTFGGDVKTFHVDGQRIFANIKHHEIYIGSTMCLRMREKITMQIPSKLRR
jgi:hypothetical protein